LILDQSILILVLRSIIQDLDHKARLESEVAGINHARADPALAAGLKIKHGGSVKVILHDGERIVILRSGTVGERHPVRGGSSHHGKSADERSGSPALPHNTLLEIQQP